MSMMRWRTKHPFTLHVVKNRKAAGRGGCRLPWSTCTLPHYVSRQPFSRSVKR
jgi:hypothetical protein